MRQVAYMACNLLYLDKHEFTHGSYPAIYISSNILRMNSLPTVILSLEKNIIVWLIRAFENELFETFLNSMIWKYLTC